MSAKKITILLLGLAVFLFSKPYPTGAVEQGDELKEIFEDEKKLLYKVYYNGVLVGKLEWVYLGKEFIGEKEVNVLCTDSDTKILEFLNLTSKEKVFLDANTHLPLKVERDLIYFGKKELIEEVYNQDEGYVKIIKSNAKIQEKILYQNKPIHSILSLLYFFPKEVALEKGDRLTFNLPTQKVKIRVKSYRKLEVNGEEKETYFLEGRGAKRFNLWLDKNERTLLRVEFFLPIGKVTIKRTDF